MQNDRNSMNRHARRRRLAAVVDTCEPRRLLASVSGTVYNDADRDGVRDSGESGLSGITVFADKNFDGVLQSTELRATTDASGFYRIGGIVADNTSSGIRLNGVAASRITAPAGGGHSARFGSDYEAAGRNFGVAPAPATTGTISGFVFNDANGDGSLNGDAGIANVRVYDDANRSGGLDAGEASALTNSAGEYALTLPAGDRAIRATLAGSSLDPAAYTQTSPAGGAANLVSLAAGNTVAGVRFGFAPRAATAPSATVTGFVYIDANRNGLRDAGDGAIADVAVYADLDYDGVKDANEPATASRADGAYTLAGIPLSNGSIAIRAIPPSGATFTVPSNGAHSGRFGAAVTYGNRNFGLVTATTPTVGAAALRTFYDADGDGAFDAGEVGPTDAIAWADLNGNGLRESDERFMSLASTDGGAATYVLAGLAPGTYKLALRRAGDADGYADYTTTVTVVAGTTTTVTLALPTTSSLGGIVYLDADGDGTRDSGESRTAGVVVFADYDFDGVRDASEPQTTTLSDGSYKLYGIRSDNVAFRVTALVAGATFTQPATGYYQARFDRAYDLASQGGRDFGYRIGGSSVSGVVYNDVNASGVRDAGEAVAAGVTVFADYDGDRALDAGEPSTTTAADGSYTVAGIRSIDAYAQLHVANLPAGAVRTYPAAGGHAFYFNGARVETGYDFGYLLASQAATVSGTVYADANGNGRRDAGEAGLGVDQYFSFRVYGDIDNDGALDNTEPYAFVDASGNYALTGLPRNRTVTVRYVSSVPEYALAAPTAYTYTFNSTTSSASGANFGADRAIVTGNVFLDADRDGVRDAGEGAANGAAVYADLDGNGAFDYSPYSNVTLDAWTRVDAQGNFTLVLPRGTYSLGVVDLTAPAYSDYAGGEVEGSGVYSRNRGFVQTGADAQVNTADLSTIANRSIGAVGASLVSIFPKPKGITGTFPGSFNGTLSAQTEMTVRTIGPLAAWVDLDRDGARDANEPTQGAFHKNQADGDGYFAYFLVAADGAPFQFAFARNAAIGAAAMTVVNGTGSASGPSVFQPEITPDTSTFVGMIFHDTDRDGVRDPSEGGYVWDEDDSIVFADYDGDGVLDADEPSTTPFGLWDGEESGLLGVFILQVEPGRAFTPAIDPRYGPLEGEIVRTSLATQRFSIPANTFRGVTDVGYYFDSAPQTAIVSGIVRNDADRDGLPESAEGGLQGVSVFVDLNLNNARDRHEPSAITDVNGYYAIRTPPGHYGVFVERPTRAEVANGTMADGRPTPRLVFSTGPTSISVTADAGRQRGGYDLAAVPGGYAPITVRSPDATAAQRGVLRAGGQLLSWVDLDRDNVRDAGEPDVRIEEGAGTGYSVEYQVHSALLPAGVSTRVAFDDANNSRAAGTPAVAWIDLTVAAGAAPATPTEIVAPNVTAGVLGYLFDDANGNGVRDGSEARLAAGAVPQVTVYADYDGDGRYDSDEAFARVFTGFDSTGNPFQSSLAAYFYLPVAAGRTFVLRIRDDSGVVQTGTAPSMSVAANTTASRDIGSRPRA